MSGVLQSILSAFEEEEARRLASRSDYEKLSDAAFAAVDRKRLIPIGPDYYVEKVLGKLRTLFEVLDLTLELEIIDSLANESCDSVLRDSRFHALLLEGVLKLSSHVKDALLKPDRNFVTLKQSSKLLLEFQDLFQMVTLL